MPEFLAPSEAIQITEGVTIALNGCFVEITLALRGYQSYAETCMTITKQLGYWQVDTLIDHLKILGKKARVNDK